MKLSEKISCKTFPCKGIEQNSYQIPNLDIDPNKIKIVMISEVPPLDPKDYFYSLGDLFTWKQQNKLLTMQAILLIL